MQETLHFDPRTEAITSLRSKEEAHDYRYFPEPDLVPIAITEAMLERARAAMPELPADRAARFERELGLSADSARLLAWRAELGDYFEAALPRPTAPSRSRWRNWVDASSARASAARTRRRRGSRRRRWRRSSGMVGRRDGHPGRARGRCSTGSSPRAATRPRSSRPRASAAMGGGDELEPVVAGGARRQPRRGREAPRAAT